MKIHEFQAKGILRRFGVPVLAGEPATTPDEAVAGAEKPMTRPVELGGGSGRSSSSASRSRYSVRPRPDSRP